MLKLKFIIFSSASGQVSVWWAGERGGVRSSCWPQDLYRVGEYDSEEGELWDHEDDDEDSDGGNESWETEEEEETIGDAKEEDILNVAFVEEEDMRCKLAEKVEKAGLAMSRLESLLTAHPSLQSPLVVKTLLEVVRDCKALDKLMKTELFHEREFSGLLEKVRDHDRISSVDQAVKDQLRRLSSVLSEESPGKDSGNGSFVEEASNDNNKTNLNDSVIEDNTNNTDNSDNSDSLPNNLMCGKLCSLIKTQLLKAQEEVVKRFGKTEESVAGATGGATVSRDMSGTRFEIKLSEAEMQELNTLVERGLAALNFVPIENEFKTPAKLDKPGEEVPPTPDTDPQTPLLDRSLSLTTPLTPGSFVMCDTVPDSHRFKLSLFNPNNMKNFLKHVRKELKLMQTSLPAGIIVKGYEDRMDVFSAMIHGPKNTPYEDGLFFFDFLLPPDYPSVPPQCHYVAYCTDRLNPNLYEEGKVCVSLLGTWSGKGTETWTSDSNLLQLLVSIQGLILVPEPYFNEAGYERQKGTQTGEENSRMYNEMAVLKMIQSMTRLVKNPAQPFTEEIREHMTNNAHKFIARMRLWRKLSMEQSATTPATPTTPGDSSSSLTPQELPDFPLIPASRGFCLTMDKALSEFDECLREFGETTETKEIDLD